jgi:hypothetical protein
LRAKIGIPAAISNPDLAKHRRNSLYLNQCHFSTKMNRTAKIKMIILAMVALPNLFFPAYVPVKNWSSVLAGFFFGSFITPVIVKFNSWILKLVIAEPQWDDNPFNFKKPLAFFHFSAWFFLAVGGSIFLSILLRYQKLDYIGIMCVVFGLGFLAGIRLTMFWENGRSGRNKG